MKICVTRSERHSYSETFIRDQISGLSRLAQVFTIHSGRFPERKEDGSLLGSPLFWVLHKIVKTVTGNRNTYFGNAGVSKFLATNKIEVVISNYGISAAHLMPVCRDLHIPLIAIFHGHDATDRKLLRQYRTLYSDLFQYASSIVVVSQEMRDRLVGLGAFPAKVQVVPCGVDISKFKESYVTRERLFVAVGRFVPKKGPLHTIRAFNLVWKKYPEARLTMVGRKTGVFDQCEKLVEALGMKEAVHFPGVLKQDEISELMGRATAFVQHSITAPNGDMEGTPVSILEASASCLPVVSTLHGGIRDAVVHGVSGFLVTEGDVEAMSGFMMQLLEDPSLRDAMGREGRKHIVKHYAQENQIRKLFTLAEDAIRKTASE